MGPDAVGPFSQRDGWTDETLRQVKDAETYRLTGKGEALRVFIVEADVPITVDGIGTEEAGRSGSGLLKSADGRHELRSRIRSEEGERVLSVGFAFVRENWIPKYILSQDHLGREGEGCFGRIVRCCTFAQPLPEWRHLADQVLKRELRNTEYGIRNKLECFPCSIRIDGGFLLNPES